MGAATRDHPSFGMTTTKTLRFSRDTCLMFLLHCSGYMSEGGASLYAKRMQQRFREGMAAVKECMQKSSGVIDDDR